MPRAALGRSSRRDHPIWRVDEAAFELARLAAIVFSLDMRTQAGSDPIKRLVGAVNSTVPGQVSSKDGDDSYNAIYRFLNFESIPDEARVLDLIAAYVGKRLTGFSESHRNSKVRRMKGELDILKAFADHGAGRLDPGYPASYYARSDAGVRASIHIDIKEEQFEDASTYLTSHAWVAADKRSESSAFYACFRYSVRVGEISKNHFEIWPCTDIDPVCRFRNTFKDRHSNVRESSGVVFKEAGWVYFVGKIDGGNGIKALAMSAVGRGRPALVQALVMSKALEPIVSRVALQRLDAAMPEVDIRVADERQDPEFSSAAFRSRVIPLIQNGVHFKSFDKIIYRPPQGEDREVNQTQMVQMIPQLLTGEFLLRDPEGNDRPFNPASHDYYPFNQAIRIKDQ